MFSVKSKLLTMYFPPWILLNECSVSFIRSKNKFCMFFKWTTQPKKISYLKPYGLYKPGKVRYYLGNLLFAKNKEVNEPGQLSYYISLNLLWSPHTVFDQHCVGYASYYSFHKTSYSTEMIKIEAGIPPLP